MTLKSDKKYFRSNRQQCDIVVTCILRATMKLMIFDGIFII